MEIGIGETPDLERLIEETVTLVGVPPSLRPRARSNILILYRKEGVAAVEDVKARALANRAAASAWLEGRLRERKPDAVVG